MHYRTDNDNARPLAEILARMSRVHTGPNVMADYELRNGDWHKRKSRGLVEFSTSKFWHQPPKEFFPHEPSWDQIAALGQALDDTDHLPEWSQKRADCAIEYLIAMRAKVWCLIRRPARSSSQHQRDLAAAHLASIRFVGDTRSLIDAAAALLLAEARAA
jgi:hypothetical protein